MNVSNPFTMDQGKIYIVLKTNSPTFSISGDLRTCAFDPGKKPWLWGTRTLRFFWEELLLAGTWCRLNEMNLVCSDEDTRNKHVAKKQWLYLLICHVDLHGFGMIFILAGLQRRIRDPQDNSWRNPKPSTRRQHWIRHCRPCGKRVAIAWHSWRAFELLLFDVVLALACNLRLIFRKNQQRLWKASILKCCFGFPSQVRVVYVFLLEVSGRCLFLLKQNKTMTVLKQNLGVSKNSSTPEWMDFVIYNGKPY